MIKLTRLDRHEIGLNCDLIESVDARPDTTVRLVTGSSLVVRESVDEVLDRIQVWRASLLERAGLGSLLTQALTPVLLPSLRDALEVDDGGDILEILA